LLGRAPRGAALDRALVPAADGTAERTARDWHADADAYERAGDLRGHATGCVRGGDSVVVCERPPGPGEDPDKPVPVLAVMVEPQNSKDARKFYSRPAYVANVRWRLRCPVALLAVVPSSGVADYYSKPIDLGCGEIRPRILALDTLKPITDPKTAAARPMLTILALANNPPTGEDGAAAQALDAALESIDGSSSSLYSDHVFAALEATAPGILEKFMKLKDDYKYRSELMGRPFREGKAEGKAEAVLTVLKGKGIEVPEEVRERIGGETDLDLLDTWLSRAVLAERAEDVFGEQG
jgi:hypothetical protein